MRTTRQAIDIDDIDPSVWTYVGARGGPPRWRTACASAAKRFKAIARAASAYATALRAGDGADGLRVALHEAVQTALGCDDALVGLVTLRMGLALADLVPPRAEELRLTAEEARRHDAMGIVARLNAFYGPNVWSSSIEAFDRMSETHELLAGAYAAMAGPKRAAHRPAIAERSEMLRRAHASGMSLWDLAKLLARLGVPAGAGPSNCPMPNESRFDAEEFVAARETWIAEETDKHYDLLRQVGRPRQPKSQRLSFPP